MRYLLNLVIRNMIKVLERAARGTEPHTRGARETTPGVLAADRIEQLYNRGLITYPEAEFDGQPVRIGVDPSSPEGAVFTAGLGPGFGGDLRYYARQAGKSTALARALGLPQGIMPGSPLAEAYLCRRAAAEAEANLVITTAHTTEDLQQILDDLSPMENSNPVTESAEGPSAEIESCRACGHPQHRSGDRRCTHPVPLTGLPGSLFSQVPCGCTMFALGEEPQFRTDHGPEPEFQAEAEPGEFDPSRVIHEGDPTYNDLQTYLEGAGTERDEAARRLDQREVDCGQLSPAAFRNTWGVPARLTYEGHQLWCPDAVRPGHEYSDCTRWESL